jgi:hypothetical protein
MMLILGVVMVLGMHPFTILCTIGKLDRLCCRSIELVIWRGYGVEC